MNNGTPEKRGVAHTPGPASITGCDQVLCGEPGEMKLVADCCAVGISLEERHANALLIVQAFDVATEYGMPPREMHARLAQSEETVSQLAAKNDALFAERDTLQRDLAAALERVKELEPAAECWNALCNCYRITCMGWAGLGNPSPPWPLPKDAGYAHATFNLWTHNVDVPGSRDEQDAQGRDVLSHFISKALLNEKSRAALSGAPK